MDISYLLLLQSFREATNNIFTPLMQNLSNFVISFWVTAFFAVIYWSFDKKKGTWYLLSFSFAYFLNGILKLTACVYRPWIRDARVVPAGNAMKTAGGYSFPSGHATCAAVFYGGLALDKFGKQKLIAIVAMCLAFLTLFSRNFLGVHTPQDVIVGFFFTLLVMVFLVKVNDWLFSCNKNILIFFFVSLALCVASLIYVNVKPYPLDYVAGKLIVDPQKMKPDFYMGMGELLAASLGLLIEKHFINFEVKKDSKKQLTASILSLCVLYFLVKNLFFLTVIPCIELEFFLFGFLQIFYIFVIFPCVLKALQKKGVV